MGDIRRLSPPGLKEVQEMMEPPEEEEKNWKGMVIALLVIATICSFILLSIFLLTPRMAEHNKREPLKLEDFIKKGFESRRYNGTWISDTELLYKGQFKGAFKEENRSEISSADNEDHEGISIYNIETKEKEVLMDAIKVLQLEPLESYSLSSDRLYLLLKHNVKKMGTYSSLAKYTVYATQMHILTPLNSVRILEKEKHLEFQYAEWVPNHQLIVAVENNNIYLYTPRGELKHSLTISGNENVTNGVPDISYEEHIWNSDRGLWMNSYVGGWAILYTTIDSTAVDKVPYVLYGKSANDSTNGSADATPSLVEGEPPVSAGPGNYAAYPKLFTYPYPKPGKPLPRLTLNVAKLNDRHEIVYKSVSVRAVPELADRGVEHLLSSEPVWVSPHAFIATWTARHQDVLIVSKCSEGNGEWRCERITDQRQDLPFSSLVLQARPLVSPSGDRLFLPLPVSDGASGTFAHIAMVTMDGKKQYLTHGPFVVSKIFAYREDLKKIFYAATATNEDGRQGQPALRHIFSLTHQNNSNEAKKVSCISCRLNNTASCLYNDASFSADGRHFVLQCMGPDFPVHYLMDTETESVIEMLDNSSALRDWAENRTLPKIRHYAIQTQKRYDIRVQLILPLRVNELDDAKFPLVMETNRLPGSQSVTYQNKLDWARYLTSRRDYITARIDTRGSAFQGDSHEYSVYGRVGELELEDLKVALAFIKQLPYVDDSKIAVWGTEYGAYLATGMLAKENAVACAVATSPITSWKNYLSVFTERFMGRPEENFLSYENTELMHYSPLLKGKTLLIVHGTIDRRVNIQQSMQFMKNLASNAIQYRTQLYPDSGSLDTWDEMVRYHFYRTLEDFFAKCFQVEEDDKEEDILITKVDKGQIKVKPV